MSTVDLIDKLGEGPLSDSSHHLAFDDPELKLDPVRELVDADTPIASVDFSSNSFIFIDPEQQDQGQECQSPSSSIPLMDRLASSQVGTDFSAASCHAATRSSAPECDAAAAALLQILAQAVLQQTQLMMFQRQQDPSSPNSTDKPAPAAKHTQITAPMTPPSPRELCGTGVPLSLVLPEWTAGESLDDHRPLRGLSLPSSAADTPVAVTPVSRPFKRKRRAREVSDLLPLEAPIQKRTYLAPSATAAREVNFAYEVESQAKDEAPDHGPDEKSHSGNEGQGCLGFTTSGKKWQSLLAKRWKNTLAARQSRHRRAKELSLLRRENDQLAMHNLELRRLLEQAEEEIKSWRATKVGSPACNTSSSSGPPSSLAPVTSDPLSLTPPSFPSSPFCSYPASPS